MWCHSAALTAQSTPSSGLVSASVTLLTTPTHTSHTPVACSVQRDHSLPQPPYHLLRNTYGHACKILIPTPPHTFLYTYTCTSCMYPHRHTTHIRTLIHKDNINPQFTNPTWRNPGSLCWCCSWWGACWGRGGPVVTRHTGRWQTVPSPHWRGRPLVGRTTSQPHRAVSQTWSLGWAETDMKSYIHQEKIQCWSRGGLWLLENSIQYINTVDSM